MDVSQIAATPGRYVALHTLRTVSAVNLNAGFDGQPKTMQLGGARRMRVSSQSTKRAMRSYITTQINSDERATRTRLIPQAVEDALPHVEDSLYLAAVLLRACGFKVDAKHPERVDITFMPRAAIPALARIVEENADLLRPFVATIKKDEAATPAKKATAAAKKGETAASVVKGRIEQEVWAAFAPGANIEIALGGRMLTALPEDSRHIGGAMAVAHAYTVDPMERIRDDWTTVDDWFDGGFTTAHKSGVAPGKGKAKNDAAGEGSGDDAENTTSEDDDAENTKGDAKGKTDTTTILGSGTLYQWAMLDRDQLRRNLAEGYTGDPATLEAAAVEAERLFITAFTLAPASAKARSTATGTLPDCVVALVSNQPAHAVSCFRDPIPNDSPVVEEAANRIANYLTSVSNKYLTLNGGVVYWTPGTAIPAIPDFPENLTVIQ